MIWKRIPFVLPLALPLNCNANACYGSTSRPETAYGVDQENATTVLDAQQAGNQVLGVTACTADVNKGVNCNVADLWGVHNTVVGAT